MSNPSPFKTIARVALISATCLALTAPSFAAFTSDGELLPEISEVKIEVKAGHYSKAIRMLTAILTDNSRNADALNLMGYSQRKSGNKARGEAFYLQALKINPNHRGANEYLGELYVETGYIGRAEKRLAVLKKVCGTSCAEYLDLSAAITKAK